LKKITKQKTEKIIIPLYSLFPLPPFSFNSSLQPLDTPSHPSIIQLHFLLHFLREYTGVGWGLFIRGGGEGIRGKKIMNVIIHKVCALVPLYSLYLGSFITDFNIFLIRRKHHIFMYSSVHIMWSLIIYLYNNA